MSKSLKIFLEVVVSHFGVYGFIFPLHGFEDSRKIPTTSSVYYITGIYKWKLSIEGKERVLGKSALRNTEIDVAKNFSFIWVTFYLPV